jgi:cupin 2 domain-containing protein
VPEARNIFEGSAKALDKENVEELINTDAVRVERIVSRGQASPPGVWYDQKDREWVLLLSGKARLRFEGDSTLMELGPGDWVNIPAHAKHRVEWTDPDGDSVWLAIFY